VDNEIHTHLVNKNWGQIVKGQGTAATKYAAGVGLHVDMTA